jgi:hypothetical protein
MGRPPEPFWLLGAAGRLASALFFGVKHYRNPMRCRLGMVGLVVLSAVFVPACNRSTVKLYPVTGKVLYKDQPAEGAQIVFQPAGDENAQYQGPRPSAVVGPDGTFSLHTDPLGDGAPAGDYAVFITWFPENARELENPKNKLPPKYGDPTTPVLKATVKEGDNELEPFRLTP